MNMKQLTVDIATKLETEFATELGRALNMDPEIAILMMFRTSDPSENHSIVSRLSLEVTLAKRRLNLWLRNMALEGLTYTSDQKVGQKVQYTTRQEELLVHVVLLAETTTEDSDSIYRSRMFEFWSSHSSILLSKPYSWERSSQRGDKEACDLFADSLPSYSKNNADKMTDDKTTKELMKALIDYLRAKTEESKTDNEFTKSILFDEVKIIYTEEQSWPEEFEERWG